MSETATETIYAPPKADVSELSTNEPPFYVVGTTKFFLLSVLTMWMYQAYWFYRNWRNVKLHTGQDVWPIPRGIFSIFFAHSLFDQVDEKLKSVGSDIQWQPRTLAGLYVAVLILSSILDRMAAREIGSPTTDLIGLLVVPVLPMILLPVQRAINNACGDPDGSSNSGLTAANWVWMIIGTLLWLIILFGLYAIYFAPELLVG